MVATIIIELSLALYAITRYKLSTLTKLATLTLVMLATFQVSEYFVCTGSGASAEKWSRLGFVAITTLPPLGLHIMHVLASNPRRRLVAIAYLTMMGFIGFFLLHPTAFTGQQCTGNYVIFQIGDLAAGFYGLYYYGWLFTSIVLGMRWANRLQTKKTKAARRTLQTVQAMIVGYLVFMVPTALANTIAPSTRSGIPSVMCGFAVLFALILALYILPRAAKPKNRA